MKSSFILILVTAWAMVCAGQEINPRMVLAKQHAIAPSPKQVYTVKCSECGASFKAKPKTCACTGAFSLADGKVRREYCLGFKCAKCKEKFEAKYSFITEIPIATPDDTRQAKLQTPKQK